MPQLAIQDLWDASNYPVRDVRNGRSLSLYVLPYPCGTYNLSPLKVRPRKCHALQPEHGGSSRMQLACAGTSEYIDHVWHDRQQVNNIGNQPLYPATPLSKLQ